jgi:hypothetical protein
MAAIRAGRKDPRNALEVKWTRTTRFIGGNGRRKSWTDVDGSTRLGNTFVENATLCHWLSPRWKGMEEIPGIVDGISETETVHETCVC